jgi:hypothetical protein
MRESEPKFEHDESMENEKVIQGIKDFALQKKADLAAVIGFSGSELIPLIEKAGVDCVEIPRALDLVTEDQRHVNNKFREIEKLISGKRVFLCDDVVSSGFTIKQASLIVDGLHGEFIGTYLSRGSSSLNDAFLTGKFELPDTEGRAVQIRRIEEQIRIYRGALK